MAVNPCQQQPGREVESSAYDVCFDNDRPCSTIHLVRYVHLDSVRKPAATGGGATWDGG